MSIFGKRIGKIFSFFYKGKPKTIEHESEDHAKETVELVKKINSGDETAKKEFEDKFLNKEFESLGGESQEVSNLKNDIDELNGKLEAANKNKKIKETMDNLLESNSNFQVVSLEDGSKKFFLKGFKSEIPSNIVQKFAELLSKNERIDHLIKFWQLALLNRNKEARRGLYKYLQKQKMIITQEGYFVAFRRIVSVKTTNLKYESEISDQEIKQISDKIKSWRKGRGSFDIYKNKETGKYVIKSVKFKNSNNEFIFIDNFKDLFEKNKIKNDGTNLEDIYTDNHTKKMIIKMNQPVKIDRSKCNEDGRVECSFGLHVGTPTYVSSNSLGDTIVAVLVNPMHVISVPYSDAHKMRVCEYFPFKILTRDELLKFDKEDISLYEYKYKEIENKLLQESLNVIDNLSSEERKMFEHNIHLENTDELVEKISKKQSDFENKKKSLSLILNDNINEALNIEEITKIVKSRIN